MLTKNQKIIPVFLGLFLLALAQSTVAEIVVIANKASTVDSLSASQVKALFLQKEKSFADGNSVMLSDQNSGSAARKEFGNKILGKSQKKLKRYWSKRVFAGKGVPPKVVGDDAAVKQWVAKTPNGLGYINAEALDDTVKVVFKP